MFTRIHITASMAALAAAVALAAPERASAGQYHVYSCRTPAGEVAPADGWTGSVAPGSAFDDYTLDSCSSGGALTAALGESTTHEADVDRATWMFETPGGLRMVAAELSRAGYLHGAPGEKASYEFWLAAPTITEIFDECIFTVGCHVQGEPGSPSAAANRVEVPKADLGRIFASVACGAGSSGSECKTGFSDANNFAAVIYIYAADITLEQSAGPTSSGVGGELANAATVAGVSDVTFQANDPGAGVYAANVTVDGVLVQSTVLNENGGRCRNVGETADGLPAFLYVQPCLQSLNANVAVDTTRFANGVHHLVVAVANAAGNSATVLDRNITIANPVAPGAGGPGAGGQGAAGGAGVSGQGAPNGTNASPFATLTAAWRGARGTRLVTPYGRTETVQGKLLAPGGLPIAGAQIETLATPSYAGARTAALASPVSRADGSFTLRVPKGASSRTLRFAYRSHIGDPQPAALRALTLIVRAAVRLSIAPHTASVGTRIHFAGRVLGVPVPAIGKLLVLEARSGGGTWIKFNVVRSDRAGRFRTSYRFRFPGPARYQFRAVSEAEGDYPYAAGSSNMVVVNER
jgi:hypothetical protein